MFDVWLHRDSLYVEVQARDRAGAGGLWDEAAGAAVPLDVLQMDATLGSAGQARLDFEDSLSTLVCVCWADHFSHCASPQSNGAPQFFLQRPCWLPEGLEGFREPYLVMSTRALLLAWAVRF